MNKSNDQHEPDINHENFHMHYTFGRRTIKAQLFFYNCAQVPAHFKINPFVFCRSTFAIYSFMLRFSDKILLV